MYRSFIDRFGSRLALSKKTTTILLMTGILFVAADLRAPLTSVGPLVPMIREDLVISNTLAGMITALPLFAFALFSPFAPILARKYGTELVLFGSIVFLTSGIVIRSSSGSVGLFAGTAILGLAIAVCNVLMPGLIKQDHPQRVGFMFGLYMVSMNIFASLASGISIPIASGGSGWSGTLAMWAILSGMTIVLWVPRLKQAPEKNDGPSLLPSDANKRTNFWRSPLAWQVAIYMGSRSLVFYSMVAWLPDILIRQGMASRDAGRMLSLLQLASIPFMFIVSVIAGRRADQRALVTVGSICVVAGLFGLLFGGSQPALLWAILLGIGGGFTFSLATMFFSLRTKDPDGAARLSGMARSGGYMMAAVGPILFGFLHDATGRWESSLVILLGAAFLCCLVGLGASRNALVGLPEEPSYAPTEDRG